MVSTLMHAGVQSLPTKTPANSDKDQDHLPTSSTSTSSSSKLSTSRLLVCAPSNAAVDEVLLRLLKEGVVNRDGKLQKPKLVRLGKPLENSAQEIIDLTLENQVIKLLQRDPAWKKLQKALGDTSSLKLQISKISESCGKSVSGGGSAPAELRRKLRSDLRLAHGAKIASELQVSLRKTALRRALLETCDVLAGLCFVLTIIILLQL
jgi:hypothetical protein